MKCEHYQKAAEPNHHQLKNKLYSAIGRSMAGRYLVYAANLISLMVLARVFTPQIFGTVASVTVLLAFFQIISEAGLSPAIINTEKISNDDRNGIFSLTILIGTVLSVLFIILTPYMADFYKSDAIYKISPFAAASLFFYSAAILPTATLLKDQKFGAIATSGLLAELLSTVIAILLYFIYDPIIALASKSLFSSSVSFATVYIFSKNTCIGRALLGKKITAIKPLLSFAIYQFGFNFVNYFARNLDNVLVGRYFGANALGVYDRAYQIMRYPLMLLTFAMTPAIQPAIRSHIDDITAIESIHRSFALKLSILGSIISCALIILSKYLILILLGAEWFASIPIIKILAISIPVQVVLSTSGSFFQAFNRSNLLFWSGLSSSLVFVVAMLWGINQGSLETLAWAIVISFYLNFIQAYIVLYLFVFKKSPIPFLTRIAASWVIPVFASIYLLK